MKIGVDVSDLVTNRADGTTRYTRELARRLPSLASDIDWQYFAPGAFEVGEGAGHFERIISPWPKYWTQLRLPLDLYRARPDVLFMPIQQLPYVRPRGTKTVAVIHDLAVHYYPDQFTYKDWLLLHVFSAQAVQEADAVIAVSQATAIDIARLYGRTGGVRIVHHGLDHSQWREPRDETERLIAQAELEQYDARLRQPYILFVGQVQPRKNIQRLIEAFEQIADTDPDVQLVIAGGHGWRNADIYGRIKQSRWQSRIVVTGAVSDARLRALYWEAQVFVLPSLYEGFGMPVAEAMACGTPVVTSNVSSLPEVAGGAAVLVDPAKVDSIATGIMAARREQERWRAAGLERAQAFSWERCAQETLAVLRDV